MKIKTILLATAIFLVTAPAVALDLTKITPTANVEVAPVGCLSTLDNDLVQAAKYKWFPFETLEGEKLAHWLKRYNSTPPVSDAKAAKIVVFQNEEQPNRVIVVFVDETGCVKHRTAVARKIYEDYRDKD